jgi:zinc D-Ala-D-Ala carboxypeptidase
MSIERSPGIRALSQVDGQNGEVTTPGPHHARGARHGVLAESDAAPHALHAARSRRGARIGMGFGAAGLAALLVAGAAAVTTAMAGGPLAAAAAHSPAPRVAHPQTPPPLTSTPTPAVAPPSPCDLPGVVAALESGDDAAVVTAMGGGAEMRAAVAGGTAPCIDLSDPARIWMVVDKARAYDPLDYAPAHLARVKDMRVINAGILRTDSGAALTRMAEAAKKAGAGQIAITSGYRSYANQKSQYSGRVSSKGQSGADALSARPGFSEHQSGLAADVVACDGGCTSIEHFAATAQGKWLAANSWRYGFVVRYEKGETGTTGYSPEPWHIRYVGVELATAYHRGGFHTLEDFWGLAAAPDYVD